MCGISPRHIQTLCKNPFDGGFGFTPSQVGDMTLDQVFMILADKNNLRSGRRRVKSGDPFAFTHMSRKEDGKIRGRAEDGSVIYAEVSGKSLCQILTEQVEEENRKKQTKPKRLSRHERWLARQKEKNHGQRI